MFVLRRARWSWTVVVALLPRGIFEDGWQDHGSDGVYGIWQGVTGRDAYSDDGLVVASRN